MPMNMTADALGDHDPLRVNNALLEITGVGNVGELKLALETFPIPKRALGIIEMGHLNEKRKYAGNPVFEDLSVVYKDLVTLEVKKALDDWWKQHYNATTGAIGYAKNYKKDGRVLQYGPDGRGSQEWRLKGVWISNFDPGDAEQMGEDFFRITLTLTIDKAWAHNLAAVVAAAI